MTRRLAVALLVALVAQTSAPLAALAVPQRGHHQRHAAETPGHHHPGCPWRDARGPCPHEAYPAGPALAACPDGAASIPSAFMALVATPAMRVGWRPPRTIMVTPASASESAAVSVHPSLDPPPPRAVSVR